MGDEFLALVQAKNDVGVTDVDGALVIVDDGGSARRILAGDVILVEN